MSVHYETTGYATCDICGKDEQFVGTTLKGWYSVYVTGATKLDHGVATMEVKVCSDKQFICCSGECLQGVVKKYATDDRHDYDGITVTWSEPRPE